MASGMSPELRDKFEMLKMEIRAILVSANDGLTPAAMDRDYMDINGHGIPFREFGFPSLFHLLDAISDTIDAFQAPNGSIILFAKSASETRHMESLIARQKKMPRVGRFGGIIQKPAWECHGTSERREFITKRLLRLFKHKPAGEFVRIKEVLEMYESEYGESLDPEKDFYCSMKPLFELKLANHFDVKSSSNTSYSIRVKVSATRETTSCGATGTTSRPLTPGRENEAPFTPIQAAANTERDRAPAPAGMEDRKRAAFQAFPSGVKTVFTRAVNEANASAYQSNPKSPTTMSEGIKPMNAAAYVATRGRPVHPVVAVASKARKPIDTTKLIRIDSDDFKKRMDQLLDKYPNGIELVALERLFWETFQERLLLLGDTPKLKQDSLLAMFNEKTDLYHVMEKDENRVIMRPPKPKPITIQQYVASKRASIQAPKAKADVRLLDLKWNTDSPKEDANANALLKKLSPNVDRRGSACLPNGYATKDEESRDETAFVPVSMAALKEECRSVLRAHPSGISYLDFTKAYKNMTGKELDLEQYGYLSMLELVEALRDLFVLEGGPAGAILKERVAQQKPKVELPDVVVDSTSDKLAKETEPAKESHEDAEEEVLMQTLWEIIDKLPTKSIHLRDIPAHYQKCINQPFPKSDLDLFGLRCFEYGDRFSFNYANGELEILAEPEWAM